MKTLNINNHRKINTEVSLGSIKLSNPIIPASGTFAYGKEFSQLYDINILGSFVFKGTTINPRRGNPQKRIAECKSGLINSVGLENPGILEVCSSIIPNIKNYYKKPVIGNISGFSIEEYVHCARALEKCTQVGIIEVNISCPNVHGGGMAFGHDKDAVKKITCAIKENTSKPVYMKLSPNAPDIVEIAKACEEAGANGISMINTIQAMRIDIKNRRPMVAAGYGGLSGEAIFPIALRMVNQVYKAVNIPIIGMGGISSGREVIEMIMAGATAVQIGTANLINPWVCKEIIEELPIIMEELGIYSLEDIIGVV